MRRKKEPEVRPMFDPFSDDNLIDRDWYPQFINKKERELMEKRNRCDHFRWVKKCSECGLIFESEHTHPDPAQPPIVRVTFEQTIIL